MITQIITISNIISHLLLVAPNSQGQKKSEQLGLFSSLYKLVTKMLSDTSESRLMVPPLTLRRHWLPVSELITSASTPG